MRIADILRRKGHEVVTIASHRTVQEAICLMNQHRIGAVVATDEHGDVTGIITERDVLRECGERCTHLSEATGERACPALVRDVMTKQLIIGGPQDDVDHVMSIMTKNRIRHLPVFDGREMVGLISIGDAVNALVEAKDIENRQLKSYVSGTMY